jgi:hypothetical protein
MLMAEVGRELPFVHFGLPIDMEKWQRSNAFPAAQ